MTTPAMQAIVDRLVEAATAYFPALTPADVYGRDRRQDAVACRAAVAYTLRASGWLVTDIGEVLNRDHSTVCHLVKRHTQGRYRAVTVQMPTAVAPPLDLARAIEARDEATLAAEEVVGAAPLRVHREALLIGEPRAARHCQGSLGRGVDDGDVARQDRGDIDPATVDGAGVRRDKEGVAAEGAAAQRLEEASLHLGIKRHAIAHGGHGTGLNLDVLTRGERASRERE